jgi:hypothetical protein
MKAYFPAFFLLVGLGAVAGAEPAGDAWNVVLPVGLDARIEGQILERAAQEQAAVHFFHGLREVPRPTLGPGEILIELRQEKATFLGLPSPAQGAGSGGGGVRFRSHAPTRLAKRQTAASL